MAITAQNVGVASQTVFTSPADETAITMLSLCNYDAGPVNVTVHVVPNGTSALTENLLLSTFEITANNSYVINEKIFLDTGDTIVVVVAGGDVNKVTAVTSYVTV